MAGYTINSAECLMFPKTTKTGSNETPLQGSKGTMEATPAYLRREARDDELARSLATLTRFQSFDEMRLRKQKSEYHPRPCFEALTSATNLIIRQIQGKAARKAFRKD
jgi:hypothetical protein